MKVLVINCGSSSLKYQLIDSETEAVLAKGIAERIGLDGRLEYRKTGLDKEKTDLAMPTHREAIQFVLNALTNEKTGAISDLSEIGAVGHRIVHGGEYFHGSALVDDDVLAKIEELSDLAPLHNPANLTGIRVCQKLMPGVPMVVVFDTAFHQTMPAEAYMYGLPYEYYEKYKIRRYGFHGTSHQFVSQEMIKMLNLDPDNSKVIVCHLGNGASISAVKNSKCIDTSMGLTPLEGLVMGTRSGNIDPAVMSYLADKEGLGIRDIMRILNRESGVYGLSKKLSSDFRDLEKAMYEGNPYAKLARDVFCYNVLKTIGAYIAAMGGVDAIAFTAGIGENDDPVRAYIVNRLGYLGVKLDEANNKKRGEIARISTEDSAIPIYLYPTNEELAICRETEAIVGK